MAHPSALCDFWWETYCHLNQCYPIGNVSLICECVFRSQKLNHDVSCRGFLIAYPSWDLYSVLNLQVCVICKMLGILSHYFLDYIFTSMLSSPSWIPIQWMLDLCYVVLSYRSLRLYYLVLCFFFSIIQMGRILLIYLQGGLHTGKLLVKETSQYWFIGLVSIWGRGHNLKWN